MQVTGGQHLAGLVLVGRRHDQHVRQAAQVRQVEAAGVGRAVLANQTGAVDGKQHVQILHRNVVDQLIVAALQEGRVDGNHRLGAFTGHARSEGDGMLLCDGDVEVAPGETLGEGNQVRAFLHCRSNADQALVLLGHVAQPLAKDVREFRFAGAVARGLGLQLGDGVVADRVGLGGGKPLALLGDHVEELRALELAHVLQGAYQRRQVVPVDRADVVPAQLLEQGARHQHALGVFFGLACQLPGRRNLGQDLLAALAHVRVGATGQDLGQVVGQSADIARDRHVVVVQHDQHVGFDFRGVVERFKGHARGQRAVADHGNGAAIQALQPGSDGHAQAGADRGAGMADAKGVVGAFTATREGGQTVLLAQAGHLFAAAGENLVRVGLMANVPQQAVVRRVIDVVQGDGQFDDAQPRAEMPAGLADTPEQKCPQLIGQLGQLAFVKRTQRLGVVDTVQQRRAGAMERDFVESAGHQTRLWVPTSVAGKQGRSLTDAGR